MAFWTYILRCADGTYYTGHTDALEARIGAHRTGAVEGHTKHRRPVTLVWTQDFPSRIEALEAERRIKGWTRAKKEALIAGDWERLTVLARSRPTAERPSTSSGRTGKGGPSVPESKDVEIASINSVRAELVEARPTANP